MKEIFLMNWVWLCVVFLGGCLAPVLFYLGPGLALFGRNRTETGWSQSSGALELHGPCFLG